jgi:hypothetical protein
MSSMMMFFDGMTSENSVEKLLGFALPGKCPQGRLCAWTTELSAHWRG